MCLLSFVIVSFVICHLSCHVSGVIAYNVSGVKDICFSMGHEVLPKGLETRVHILAKAVKSVV